MALIQIGPVRTLPDPLGAFSQSATRTKVKDRTIRSVSSADSFLGWMRSVARNWASTFLVLQRDRANGWSVRISTRHALAELRGKRDNDALRPADVG
jgi:hypothetical protein